MTFALLNLLIELMTMLSLNVKKFIFYVFSKKKCLRRYSQLSGLEMNAPKTNRDPQLYWIHLFEGDLFFFSM